MVVFMKKLIVLFLFLFTISVFGLSIDTNSVDYVQGDTLYFFGNCKPNSVLEINSVVGVKKIFNSSITCSNDGNFLFKYDSSFIDPFGEWLITLTSNDTSVKKIVKVNASRKASFYLITFLSPSSREINKAIDLDLVVKVTDKGTPVNNAEVYFFGLNGEKKQMRFVSDGVYSYKYLVPFNAVQKFWNLLVLTQKETNEERIGGFGEMNLALKPAIISIEFIEPKFDSIDLSVKQKIPIKVKVNYLNEKPLIQGKVKLVVGEKELVLNQLSENLFYMEYLPNLTDLGSIDLKIVASDSAGNQGLASKIVQTSGELIFILKQNIFLILLISVLIIGSVLFFSNKFVLFSSLKKLKEEEEKIMRKIKELQEDYFLNQKINPEQYKKTLAEYNAKLVAVREKINKFKK